MYLTGRKPKTFSERELQIMRSVYQDMKMSDFCKMYSLSTTTVIKLMWRKNPNNKKPTKTSIKREPDRVKEQWIRDREKTNIAIRTKEVMEKTWLKDWEIDKLLLNYTMSEIENWYWENWKFIVKELVKIYK